MDNQIRKRIRFTGRVQGVGFRYTATNIANTLGLTGWVYNDFDGSVLVEVQGEKKDIAEMIEKLDTGVFIQIENMETKEIPLVHHESNFKIKDYY